MNIYIYISDETSLSGTDVQERYCQFGIGYDWDSEFGVGIIKCQCKILGPNPQVLKTKSKKKQPKSIDNTWNKLDKCRNHNKKLGTSLQMKVINICY